MMVALHPYLPFHPEETLTSYVRRSSMFHTGQGTHRLLADLDITPKDVETASFATLTALAEMAGVELAALQEITIGRIDRCRTFRGDRWSREFVKTEGARICSKCLSEDTETGGTANQKIRIAWRLRPVFTCPIHNCALIDINDAHWTNDLEAPFYSHDSLLAMGLGVPHQEQTQLERWVFAKLSGDASYGGGWLDGHTIEQGVRVCEMLGSVLLHGIWGKLKDVPTKQLRLNAAAGFEVACLGPVQVIQALDQIRASSDTTAGQAGPKAMYGRLFEWLAYGTPIVDQGPIKELLREHILNHTAIETGTFLLGRKVSKRRCHSVYSLSLAKKIHPKRLRKILECKGMIPANCSDVALNLLVFPAEETEKLCDDLVGSVSLSQLPLEIGGSRTQVQSLYGEDIIKAIIERAPDVGIGRIDFARVVIDNFLSKMEDLPIGNPSGEMHDLTVVTKRTGMSTGRIISHIIAGRLSAFRIEGRIGINMVRVLSSALCEFKANRSVLPDT